MDRASSLIYPGSRTLVTWWRQLQPFQPLALWIGYAFLHRIEAPLYLQGTQPIEPLTSMVLQAIALEQRLDANLIPDAGVHRLKERLRLPDAIVQRMLVNMQEMGLLEQDRWQMTEQGRSTLKTNHIPHRYRARRVLPFVEVLDAAGQRMADPQFVPCKECPGAAWQVETQHRFEPRFLRSAIDQSASWKQTFGFPSDVERLADDASVDAAHQVLVDRPQRVMLAMIATTHDLIGCAVKVDGWTLFDRDPALRLPAAARSGWPELRQDPPMQLWQDAWRSWCRQRQLPMNEVEICTLTYRAPRLEVQAPPRMVQRLQGAKSDLFKGEAWILIGDGFVRTAALLTMKPP